MLKEKTNHFDEAIEKYQEALEIFMYFFISHENKNYLPKTAFIFSKIADLHLNKEEFQQAIEKYHNALTLYKMLVSESPENYLQNLIENLVKVSAFYLQSIPDKEQSISFAMDALKIASNFQTNTTIMEYAETAMQILIENDLTIDEIKSRR